LGSSAARDVDLQRQRVYRSILLFLFALFGPFLVGYQYLEWFHGPSSHITWFAGIGIGSIENSNWTEGVWVLKTIFSMAVPGPFAVLGSLAILLSPRLIFASVASMYDAGRLGPNYVVAAALPVIAVTAYMLLGLMTANIILGTPPGVLISITAPDIDSRLFLPTPILLVLGFIIFWSKGRT
jgi:hypothetical protein